MRKIKSLTLFYIFSLIYMTILIECLPTTTTFNDRNSAVISKEIINHLTKYGYLSEKKPPRTGKDLLSTQSPTNTYTDKELEAALKDYQEFMNLPITGRVDDKTLNNMNKSRCGVKDKTPRTNLRVKMVLTSSGRRKKRFAQNNNQFNSYSATKFWYLVDPKPKSNTIINSLYHQLEYAFNMWAGVSNTVFIRGDVTKYSDILIGFYSGGHRDGEKFDGPGGVIAHASAGLKLIHFDQDENWSDYSNGDQFRWLHPNGGSDFIQCAMHEIGHILGLLHVNDTLSAMHPALQRFPYLTEYSLSVDDVARVKSSYGRCEPNKIDSIFVNRYQDGRTYIIVGPYAYQFNNEKRRVEFSWPRSITLEWVASTFADEVFWHNGWMYWFIGDEYYVYSTSQRAPTRRYKIGKSMSSGQIGWRGLREPKVDAAFVVHVNPIIEEPYLIRNNLVYKYIRDNDYSRLQLPYLKLVSGWPKEIKDVFPGIPNNVDTAFTWDYDNRVYFFKGKYFYVWDPKSVANSQVKYGLYQWHNICDVYKCMIGPRANGGYKCESWDYTFKDCYFCRTSSK